MPQKGLPVNWTRWEVWRHRVAPQADRRWRSRLGRAPPLESPSEARHKPCKKSWCKEAPHDFTERTDEGGRGSRAQLFPYSSSRDCSLCADVRGRCRLAKPSSTTDGLDRDRAGWTERAAAVRACFHR